MSGIRRRVMLGFHSPVDYRLLREWMAGLGFEIVKSLDAAAGIDLLLLDSVTGRRLMDKALRLKREAKYFLPVLVCINDAEDAGPWFKAGFDDVLHLPATKDEWRARIDAMLRLRRQSEELSEKSEYLQRALIDSSEDHIFLLDANGAFVTSNNRTAFLALASGDELVGRTIEQVYPRQVAPLYREQFQRVLDEGKAVVFEHDLPSDQEIHHRLNTFYPVNLPGGTVMVGGIDRDITEQKKLQRQNSINLKRLEEAERIGKSGNWSYELATGRIIWSPGVYRIYGVDPQKGSIDYEKLLNLIHPDDRKYHNEYLEKMRNLKPGGQIENLEYRVVRPDGEQRVVDVKFETEFGENNEPIRFFGTVLDITERKQSAQAIKEAKANLEALLDNRRDYIWALDRNYNYVVFNKPYADVIYANMGIHLERGMNALEIHPAEVGEYWRPKFDEVLEGKYVTFEFSQLLDGDEHFFAVYMNPIYGDNKITGLSALSMDITERKRAEEALRKSEARLRAAENLAKLGHWELHLQNNELLWSNEIYKIFEVDPAKFRVSYESFLDLVHPDDREWVDSAYKTSVKNRTSFDLDHRVRLEDGRIKHVHVQCETFYDQQGNPVRSLGTVQDITERARAEEDRRLLEAAINNAQECIVVGDQENRLVYVNRAFERLTGYSTAEALGNSLDMLRSGQSDNAVSPDLNNMISAGKSWQGDLTFKKKNGELYKAYVTSSPICNQAGIPDHFVSVHRDVTKERELEQRIRQNQRLEAIGTLAGGIAHDLNNILAPIVGYTEMCMYSLPEGSETRENLEEVNRAAARATDLVKQILSFSRRSNQVRKPVKIALIIKEALNLLRSTIPASIQISQDISAYEESVIADPTEIHQVMMNLCINASHAMPDGGLLGIGLHAVDLDLDASQMVPGCKPGTYLKLSVEDTGQGIAPGIRDKIFEPYFTTKKEGRGTGLGLATTHSIVSACGGGITVDSEPGKGTRFDLYFPVAGEASKHAVKKPTLIRGRHENILLVDDDVAVLNLYRKVLENYGYSVNTETNPEKALALFEKSPTAFDMVLTDMTMPRLTGDLLAAAMLRIRPDLPVVVLTGFSERMNEDKARELGIRRLLTKPVSVNDLLSTISDIFEAG